MKLICVFVFAYAKCWFYHKAAQLLLFLVELYPPMFFFVARFDLHALLHINCSKHFIYELVFLI